MPEYLSFETQRLFIRPTHLEDAAFILELVNSPGWLQYIGDRKIHTEEQAKLHIRERMLPQLERLGFGNHTVIRKSDGVKIGTCGLYDRPGMEGIDLGFAFLPQYHKLGYAMEAAQRIVQAAYQNFGLNELSAITIHENTDSQNLLLKLGFEQTGTFHLPDDPEELLLFQRALIPAN